VRVRARAFFQNKKGILKYNSKHPKHPEHTPTPTHHIHHLTTSPLAGQ